MNFSMYRRDIYPCATYNRFVTIFFIHTRRLEHHSSTNVNDHDRTPVLFVLRKIDEKSRVTKTPKKRSSIPLSLLQKITKTSCLTGQHVRSDISVKSKTCAATIPSISRGTRDFEIARRRGDEITDVSLLPRTRNVYDGERANALNAAGGHD